LVITNWYPHRENPVAGVFVKELAKSVSFYDDVTIFYPEQSESILFYKITREKDENLEIIRFRFRKLRLGFLFYFISILFSIIWLIRHWKELSPDVIHAHNYLTGFWAIFIAKITKTPLVITEHGLHREGDDYKEYRIKRLRHIFKRFAAKIAFRNAGMLVFVSYASRDYIKETFSVSTRGRIIPNVLNKSFLEIDIDSSPSNQKKKILFVGILTPRKGVDYLLKAIRIVKNRRSDFILEIIGGGPFKNEYEKLAVELGLDNVVFLGSVEDETKIAAMKNCHFFILPSVYENFGVVLIEAMACGKPVITTLSGGQKEFVNKDNGILVPPKDPEALAKAIDYMLDHYSDYSPEKISRYVLERFSPKVVGRQLHEAYLEVIKGGGG